MTLTKGMVINGLKSDGVALDTIRKVMEYHSKNPELYEAFKRFALEVAQAGKKIGSMAIVNRIRWYSEIECKGAYLINNTMAPYYARIFEIEFPEYEIFEKRKTTGVKEIK